MNDALNPRARAFLQSVEDADDPTLADCERVHAKLKWHLAVGLGALAGADLMANELSTGAAGASLPVASTGAVGAGVTAGASVPVVTTAAGATLAAKIGAAALAAGMITAATVSIVRFTERPPLAAGMPTSAARERALSAIPLAPAPPPNLNDSEGPVPIGDLRDSRIQVAAPSAARSSEAARAPATARSNFRPRTPAPLPSARAAIGASTEPQESPLDVEIRLLRDARAALRGGDAAGALAILDAHNRRFPAGALDEDCAAERIYALCALGRVDEVRALAAGFVAAHPVSPHAAVVRASCSNRLTR